MVEILIAVAILALLVILLGSLANGVNRAWSAGERQVETFQDGRAILDLMARELAQAVISPSLQFVQNPTVSGVNQRVNSSSIFWQAALTSTDSGNLCELGYFLTEDAQHNFQLKRFFVPPTDTTNYKIFGNTPSDRAALWATNFVTTPTLNTAVSDVVVAFWVRCLDSNGDPISWVSSSNTTNGDAGAVPLQFNSAAHFQPAIFGQSSSFKYTARSSTAQAHLLPRTVEVTIVTVDSKTLQRTRSTIPAMPGSVPPGYSDVPPTGFGPEDIPNAVTWFNQQLIATRIQTARTFSTRVALKNSVQ